MYAQKLVAIHGQDFFFGTMIVRYLLQTGEKREKSRHHLMLLLFVFVFVFVVLSFSLDPPPAAKFLISTIK